MKDESRHEILYAATTLLVVSVCLAAPVAGQSIVISLEASAGELVADPHAFGVHDDALPSADSYDLPEPPGSPSDYLSLAFIMPGYAGPLDNRWRCEFRPTDLMADETEDWLLHLDTDRVGETAVLTFAAEVGADLPLAVVVHPANARPRRDSLPAQFSVTLDAPHTEVVVTLIWDDPTAAVRGSWGEVKSSFDPLVIPESPCP